MESGKAAARRSFHFGTSSGGHSLSDSPQRRKKPKRNIPNLSDQLGDAMRLVSRMEQRHHEIGEHRMKRCLGFVITLVALFTLGSAQAATIPYPSGGYGIENPVEYTFTAAGTGTITAYFYGTNAAFDSELGLMINGVASPTVGLPNHTSAYGDSISWNVTAGDTLTFFLNVLSTGDTFYSSKSLNADNAQHVYSATFSGDLTIPAGIYVGFEDLLLSSPGASDFNYTDHQFVFTNVEVTQTPLPAALPLFATVLAGGGLITWRRKRKQLAHPKV